MSAQEVKCINRTERTSPHERIRAIGGIYANGTLWKLSQSEAILVLEKGTQGFYVCIEGRKVSLIVALTKEGDNYLKTTITMDSRMVFFRCMSVFSRKVR